MSLSHLEEQYGISMETSFNSLVRLKRLAIQEKKTYGEFPDLGVLKGPNYLDACDNQITSQAPSTLPRSLLELSMRNNFHGNLPDNVGDLEFYRFWFQAS